VTNAIGESVTELNAATGAFEKVLAGIGYGFNEPLGVSCDDLSSNRRFEQVCLEAAKTRAISMRSLRGLLS
jgi:hypothetical protein